MSTHDLDAYIDLVDKLSPEKIAETAGVTVEEVNAWLAGSAPAERSEEQPAPKGKAPAAKSAKPAPPAKPAPARKVAEIHVHATTAISIEAKGGRRLRLPVPRSVYRGDIARKYAALLKPSEFTVRAYEE